MMKNDITYEYRVFTNRLVDVESMEVGRCTSKVINKLKSKDKVDGRFFHTSDTDEWFFCWNGELQKLNLKGGADVNSALEEVKELIKDANAAVEEAKSAAADASVAVESIENKADKSEVEAVAKAVDAKADASVVKELSDKIAGINFSEYAKKSDIPTDYIKESDLNDYVKNSEIEGLASESFVTSQGYLKTEDLSDYAKKSEIPTIPSLDGYLTKSEAELTYAKIGSGSGSEGVDISGKQDKIEDLDDIRSGAAKGATALQEVPAEYVTEDELDAKGYLTSHQDISGKQDKIEDLDAIRSGSALGATALQEVPVEYVTEDKLTAKGYATETFVNEKIAEIVIPEVPSMDNYYTKSEIDTMIGDINALIGEATTITNTILA